MTRSYSKPDYRRTQVIRAFTGYLVDRVDQGLTVELSSEGFCLHDWLEPEDVAKFEVETRGSSLKLTYQIPFTSEIPDHAVSGIESTCRRWALRSRSFSPSLEDGSPVFRSRLPLSPAIRTPRATLALLEVWAREFASEVQGDVFGNSALAAAARLMSQYPSAEGV